MGADNGYQIEWNSIVLMGLCDGDLHLMPLSFPVKKNGVDMQAVSPVLIEIPIQKDSFFFITI